MNNPRRIQRHLVKALAAGALLAAAALPMAIAGVAGAAGGTIASVAFDTSGSGGTTNTNYFGTGASGTFVIAGTGFAGDGGNATVTTSAPGVSFTGVTDTSPTGIAISGSFASTSATVPGTYSLTVVDNAGTETLAGAFTVNATASISSLSVSSVADTTGFTPVATVATGSGFVGTPVVSLTSTVDGTSISGADVVVTPTAGTVAAPASSLSLQITPKNTTNGSPATPGTYTMTVVNPDGGVYTSGAIFTVLGNGITTLSPSALPIPGASSTTTITLSGAGFQSGAVVSIPVTTGVSVVANSTSVTSGTTATFQVTVTSAATAGNVDVTISNTGAGDNGATYTATGALGIGQSSLLAPVITASSLSASPALVAGAAATTVTFTGTGFSQYTTAPLYTEYGTANTHDTAAVISSCINGSTGTSVTCVITVGTGTTAGAHTALLANGTALGSLASAFTVDGPSIVSALPAALAVGAPIGTVIALTGTGFNNTSVLTVTHVGAGTLAGTGQYVSATSMNFVVTAAPNSLDNGDTLMASSTDAYGATENSAPFALGVDAAPTVTSITYATGTTGVGVGATAQTITINGSGLQTGATVTAFANGSAVADASVTATVTAVNTLGTQITASVAIVSPDANLVDGYTVTNPDGGVIKVPAVAPAGLTIDAGPTVTAVSPTPVLASATNAITVTGTGFATGAVVSATSNATCGSATVVSATSITVSCTFGVVGTTASSLVVTNLDGGSATSAVVLPASSTKKPAAFRVAGAHGYAIPGKTVLMVISGVGFYGQPRITSNAPGTRVTVSKDNGHLLVIHVSTRAGTRKGTHVFTVRLANGKTGRTHYSIR